MYHFDLSTLILPSFWAEVNVKRVQMSKNIHHFAHAENSKVVS